MNLLQNSQTWTYFTKYHFTKWVNKWDSSDQTEWKRNYVHIEAAGLSQFHIIYFVCKRYIIIFRTKLHNNVSIQKVIFFYCLHMKNCPSFCKSAKMFVFLNVSQQSILMKFLLELHIAQLAGFLKFRENCRFIYTIEIF